MDRQHSFSKSMKDQQRGGDLVNGCSGVRSLFGQYVGVSHWRLMVAV